MTPPDPRDRRATLAGADRALDPRAAQELRRLDRLAQLLDSRFRIPGTGIRFGLDGLIGLVPGLGDLATLAPSAYLLVQANRLGVSKATMLRMAGNTGIDFAIGAVPLLGDIFDIGFKANNRNVALLRADLENRTARASSPRP
ncbi:DUF4112 domain-containing protein [Brevirhabdus sp.]|uniref:DUF4112 domain-containing protein n=1 Tax=Brevirhabdus sp. TaxID=2004514 RepID=UPI004057EB36